MNLKKITVAKYRKPDLNTQIDIPTMVNPPVTIWVHGTKLFPRSWFTSFFFSYPGIKKAREIETKYHLRIIAETLIESNPFMFFPDTFYFYGWSGKLSFKAREQAAQDLACYIKQIIESYKTKYNTEPFIRIITHSHGGNVVLNLAQVKVDFFIDELILLACPVQAKTKHYLNNPMFAKVYALYSSLDILQILDPQGLYRHPIKSSFFSRRRFDHTDKIAQVKIKINGRAPSHIDFLLPKFVYHLPGILQEIDNWESADPSEHHLLCIKTEKH